MDPEPQFFKPDVISHNQSVKVNINHDGWNNSS